MTHSAAFPRSPTSSNGYSMEPSRHHSRKNIGRKITPISQSSTSVYSTLMKVIRFAFFAFLLFPLASGHAWKCPTPQGSYLESCDPPFGSPYVSTDPNLSGINFCSYEVSCKKMDKADWDKRKSRKVLPREDLACGTNWENCDGYLIAREGNIRLCKDRKSLNEELRKHSIKSDSDRNEL